MIFKHIHSNVTVDDELFNALYTQRIEAIADIHFTPIEVAKVAAQYLADRVGIRVLDIGSGAGKFCMVGAVTTEGNFTGIELRVDLHDSSAQIALAYQLTNLEFIHSNITDIAFGAYEAFYCFNSFYENISATGHIDETIELTREHYESYSAYVCEQLDTMPIGTKLVTYFSHLREVPDSYSVQHTDFENKLKMWKKVK